MRLFYSSQFKKDYKKIKSRGKNISNLEAVIQLLLEDKIPDVKYNDHKLTGPWKNFRDCHIEPDWILIYKKTKDSLYLERTGTHSDLFR